LEGRSEPERADWEPLAAEFKTELTSSGNSSSNFRVDLVTLAKFHFMKKRSFIVTLALAIASLPSIQAASHEGGDHDHTALEDQMSAMNKAWRSIRRQIKDPAKNDSTLEFMAKVKKAAQKSVDMTPILAKEMSGAEKKKFMAGYQKAMKNTVGLIGDLEAALKAGDNVKAEEIVGKINDARKHGHDKYKPEDD
tara:strand:+ start:951 stop:1532 length:582 start_codon:yes stop_codon:yes gene_type:complete